MGEVVSMSHHKTTTDATITDIWCLCRYITVPPSKLPKRFWRVWEKEIQTVKSRQRLLTLKIMFSSNEKYQWCLLGYKESNITKSQHYTICSSKPKSTIYPISSGKIPSATFLSPFKSPESIANVRFSGVWKFKIMMQIWWRKLHILLHLHNTLSSSSFSMHDQLAHAKKTCFFQCAPTFNCNYFSR